ncbi:CHAT domain-containing protein [Nonomuraea sp. NPDC049486]|uniref:CHAT domain-containing protein n=1 Tax=Nonomuraea sp. NPDC049486 TaxID=3155773 RepID=UPI00341FB143
MKDPARVLAARIEEFERAADPRLVLDDAALDDAEDAMLACDGGPRDAAVWRLAGVLHLARYRLAPEEDGEAAVAGVFFAAVAVLDPDGLPERLRGTHVPASATAETWAELAEQVFRHVDVDAYPHVGLLLHAILRRALATPTAEVCDRLGQVLLEQALDMPAPAWAAEALAILGNGLVRLYRTAGDGGALDDAVHALFRAALAGPGHVTDLAAALGHALAGDTPLIRAYLLAAGRPPGPERSAALLDLLFLASTRAAASCADADLLALLRVGQACLDHWHEAGAHPAVLSRYGTALVEWYVVTGDLRSLEAGRDMLAALPPAPATPPTHPVPPAHPASHPHDPASPAPLDAPETAPRPDRSATQPMGLPGPYGHAGALPVDSVDLPGSYGHSAAWPVDSLSHPGSYGHSDGWPEDPASHPGSYGYAAAWSVGLSGSYGHTAAWPEDSGPSALGNAAARLDDAATRLDLLGRRRWRRYRGSGDLADLEIAVQTLRQAVVRAPEGHPERPAFLTGLAGALLHRATRTGDARTAITAARAAVAACPGRHPQRPRALLLLGQALRLDLTAHTAAEAVTTLRKALAAHTDPRFQAEAHTVLSDVLRHRATLVGAAQQVREPAEPDVTVQTTGRPADWDAEALAGRRPAAWDEAVQAAGRPADWDAEALVGRQPADWDAAAPAGRRPADWDAVEAVERPADWDPAAREVRGPAESGVAVQAAGRSADWDGSIQPARSSADAGGAVQAARQIADLDAAVQAARKAAELAYLATGTTAPPSGPRSAVPLPGEPLASQTVTPRDPFGGLPSAQGTPASAAREPSPRPRTPEAPPPTGAGASPVPLALVKGLLVRFTVRGDEQDLVEALELAGNVPGGDPELTSLLRLALGTLTGTPDKPLAEAATRLAMVCDDEATTRDLLRLGERHAKAARDSRTGGQTNTPGASQSRATTDTSTTTDVAGTADISAGTEGVARTDDSDSSVDTTATAHVAGAGGVSRTHDGAVSGTDDGAGSWNVAGTAGPPDVVTDPADVTASPPEVIPGPADVIAGPTYVAVRSGDEAGTGDSADPGRAAGIGGRAAEEGPGDERKKVRAATYLVRAATGLAGRGRRRMAIELLERAGRAFAEAGEPVQAADTYSRIGNEHEELGAWEAALRAFEHAADGYGALGHPREEAAQRAAMGNACAQAGEPRRAAACYRRAAELCREAGLHADEATYQERAAAAYLDAGDRAEALERAGRARELHLTRGDAERAARALIPGARAGAELGHLPAAAELISTCASELEAIGKWDDACQALDGHAVLLYELGHADHAAACEAAIVDVVRRRGQRREAADEWYHIARRRLSRADVPGARRAFERAERAYNQLGHRDGVAAVRYHLGVIGFTGAGMEQATQDFGTAAEAFAAPERVAAARTMRAACLVELGRCDEASAELDLAMRPAVAEGDIGALFSIALVRATADLRTGHPDEALDRLRAALGLAAGDPLREAVVHERLAVVHAHNRPAPKHRPAQVGQHPPTGSGSGPAAGERPSLGSAGDQAAAAGDERPPVISGGGAAAGERPSVGSAVDRAVGVGGRLPVGPGGGPVAGVGGLGERGEGGWGAARAGGSAAVVEHLGLAADGFRATGHAGLAALTSLRLGFALEERGDLRRARKALEEGLSGAVTGPTGDAPYEVIPVGGAEPAVLVRLAELQFAAGEVARGRAALAQALATVRRGGVDPELAERLAERVRIEEAEAAGDLSGALALARQAAGAAADPRRRSGLLAKLCALALEADDPEAAYEYAKHGCDLRDGLLSEHLRGRGAAALALGRTAEAIGHLAESVRLARESGQAMPVRLVAALGALGAALAEDRRWSHAGAVLAEALALAAGPAWRGMRASLLAVRARTRFRQGDVDEAATLYQEALALGEAVGDDATVATVCGELAPVHAARGERDGAARLAERALDIDRARGRQRAVVRDLIALGRLGDVDRLAEALSLAQRIGFGEGQAVALAELGALDLRAGRFTAARARASAAIDLLEAGTQPTTGNVQRPAPFSGGTLRPTAAAGGQPPEPSVGGLHQREPVGDEPQGSGPVVEGAQQSDGEVQSSAVEGAGRSDLAAGEQQRSVVEGAQQSDGEVQSSAVESAGRSDVVAAEPQGSVAGGVGRSGLGGQGPGAAVGGVLWSDGDDGGGRVPGLGGAHRAELAAAYATRAAAGEELGELAAALADAERAGELDDTGSAAAERLRSRAVGLAVRLGCGARAWAHAERAKETLLGLEENVARAIGVDPGRLLDLLPEGSGVVAFHTGEALVSVVAHRAGWARPRAFATSAGPELLAEFAATARAGDGGRRRAELWRVVADLLLGEAIEALGDDLDVLYLLPHGDLHGLPLHALAPGGRLLLDRYAVAYAPSAAALARQALRRAGHGGRTLVAGQGEDAAAVAAVLGSPPVTAAARDLEGVWDTVHLACPACYDGADPYGSGIRLPGGLLNARALMDLRIEARLVAVSGCEPTPGGAGVTALGHALLRAGAAAALLPQWPAHPEVARELLPSFHARLAAAGPGRALRAAMLESRELYGSSRPDLWAPYTLIGLAA